MKKARKLVYSKDEVLLKMFNNLNKASINESDFITNDTTFIEQTKNIDRSTLFSIQSPFDLLHANIANRKFLAKSAVDLQ